VPIYLNQRIVFDLLAILEDGFSELSTVRSSAKQSETQGTGLGGSLGLSNVFALFGVSLKAKAGTGKERAAEDQTEVSEERVHTPTSLFARLRLSLSEKRLLRGLGEPQGVSSGEFVEFRAVLRKNPLVGVLEAVKRGVEMTESFSEAGSSRPKTAKQGGGSQAGKANSQLRQVNAILEDLKPSRSLDLIGEVVDSPGTTAVLSAKLDFFSDQDASELIDGEYQVLGKVTRVVACNTGESIDLLRKTTFGLLQDAAIQGLVAAFDNVNESGINLPKVVTKVQGPALQIIPIAIYA